MTRASQGIGPARPVLDASVLVAAMNAMEPRHLQAQKLLLQSRDRPFIVPPIFVIEVVSALTRRGAPPDVVAGARALCEGPRMESLPLDEPLIEAALEIAARAKLRSADAIYAGLALLEESPLFTLDDEIAVRLAEAYPLIQVVSAVAA